MIVKIIESSVRNQFLVLIATAILIVAGVSSLFSIKIDAIPDLSDVQVIITTEYPGQNPEVVENQVTYPLSSAMLSVPGAKVVRGYSMFEQSFVYVLFEDGTDIYWARSRVLEFLNFNKSRLPQGIEPKLGPDATGVGWIYQYALLPGYYSKDNPKGFYHDPASDKWYLDQVQAPESVRGRLERIRAFEKAGKDPITGSSLIQSDLDIAQMRSLQDWYLRYALSSIDDVSEVATIGGFVKQYQVVLDPIKLLAYKIPLSDIIEAIQRSNNDIGGSVVEQSEREFMVRSRGYLNGIDDLKLVPVAIGDRKVPILLGDIATIQIAGDARRGVSEYNGIGEAVGGVVISRVGANAYKVIQDIKDKLKEIENGLPAGVIIKPTYDRSNLIRRSINTLTHTLIEEIVVVGLVCMLFLLHMRSELVAVFVLPTSILTALLIMHLIGVNANIMSLGGIAISIGVVVDSAIIMVENAHKHFDREEERIHSGEKPRNRLDVVVEAASEVGPQLFFSLLIITVSFLPVFVLGGEAGRLFKPLALTKTFTMAAAALLSITIIPLLMYYFITSRVLPSSWSKRTCIKVIISSSALPAIAIWHYCNFYYGLAWALFSLMLLLPQRIIHEKHSPISSMLQKAYEPIFNLAMKNKGLVFVITVFLLLSTLYPASRLGSEFMPPLDEGDLLYMPTSDPSISITKGKELLQQTDKLISSFPEVLTVHGKIGRADTATDPAPLSMLESVVQLNPDRTKWRKIAAPYFFGLFLKERPISTEELKFGWLDSNGIKQPGLNSVVNLPGIANAWPYPIENRINMLATGIKTPVGIKVLGTDLNVLSEIAEKIALLSKQVPGTVSAYPERTTGGYYLDININREEASRYGLTTSDVQDVIQSAVGGMNITTTVEGLERYPLNVRYLRDYRDDINALHSLVIPTKLERSDGSILQVPVGQLADIKTTRGAPMIRSENAQRTAWVFIDVAGRDLGSYLTETRELISKSINTPPGYSIIFSGQYEFWEKTIPKLISASMLTLVLIIVLLYLSSRSWFRVSVVMLAVPFSLIGALWFMYIMGYNLSLAAVIGMIALAGLDAETGMVMLLYLETSINQFKSAGKLSSNQDLLAAIHDGAVKRIRPKAMTVSAAFIGLVPLLWASGTGADTMRRIAAPMIGGLLVSFVMELILYPILFYAWQVRLLRK